MFLFYFSLIYIVSYFSELTQTMKTAELMKKIKLENNIILSFFFIKKIYELTNVNLVHL